jgi:hypothetical protein
LAEEVKTTKRGEVAPTNQNRALEIE